MEDEAATEAGVERRGGAVHHGAAAGATERQMITFEGGGARFNYRVAGVAVQDGQVLLQYAPNEGGFWFLPGGRVEMLEPATVALEREMQEELGVTVQVGRLLWVVENLFEFMSTPHHELALVFAITVPPERDPRRGAFEAPEGDLRIPCVWHPVSDAARLPIYPSFLREALTDLPETPMHIVHFDQPKQA